MNDDLSGLKKILLQQVSIPETELNKLLENWNISKVVKKDSFLHKKGQIGQHLYYVHSGTFKLYYSHKGEEICVGFAYPNTVVCAYPSFIKNEPSQYYIKAITEAVLTGIEKKCFFNLVESNPGISKCWRLLTEEALLGKIQRELEMLTFSPEEKYQRLLERSPHVFQLIPQKYLASYLGMTPETFSRIKRKFLKGDS